LEPDSRLYHIAENFLELKGNTRILPLGNGLINDTYLIDNKLFKKRYVLQRINQNVFREPDKVMHNLVRILDHLTNQPDPRYQLLRMVKTSSLNCYIDEEHDYWRVFQYLENTRTIDKITDPLQALEAAKAFGNFIRRLDQLDPSLVFETIENFHNYRSRILKLHSAVGKNDHKRKQQCLEELDFIEDRIHYIESFYSLSLPLRIIHSDAKIDNILFDDQLKKAVCVIDLDIAMPGSILYDYGDMVRSYTNKVKEDAQDLSAVGIDHEVFYQLTKGFLEETITLMNEAEIKNLILGAKMIILIQAIRNLTDFLMGDVYYKIQYESHNLIRARNQLNLLKCVEKEENLFQNMINSIITEIS
jgi:thiamine kinase-like enzyme